MRRLKATLSLALAFLTAAYLPTTVPPAGDLYVGPTAQYKTIQAGVNAAFAGDTVHVTAGTYPERISSSKSGSANARIRYVCDTKWECKITPTGNGGSGWWGSYGWMNRGSYVDIDGFEITPASGASVTAGIISSGDNVQILNNKIHHINTANMNDDGPGGINAEGTNVDTIGNLIYDIGELGNRLTHGIYYSSGTGKITNNVVGNVSGYGIHLWHYAHHVMIINNTVFNSGWGGDGGGIIIGAGDHDDVYVTGCVVANNISVNNPGNGIAEFGGIPSQVGDNTFVNNLLWGNDNDWQLTKGKPTRTITGDPKFVDFRPDGTGDYQLLSGSSAIDKASTEYATIDAQGERRNGLPDIGAFEYGGTGGHTKGSCNKP